MFRCSEFRKENLFLVYLFDADAPEKKKTAQRLLEEETALGRAILSTQVLQEFYVTVTRKLAEPLSPETAESVVRNLAELTLIPIDAGLVLSAIGLSRLQGFSFWDALIISTALAGGAKRLLTEDLQHGQIIEGMRMENPFV